MTVVSKYQAKDPRKCRFHGAVIRLEEAVVSGDASAFLNAKQELEAIQKQKQVKEIEEENSTKKQDVGEGVPSFELTNQKIKGLDGKPLYRIKAVRDIPEQGVKKGDLGGYVESVYLTDGQLGVAGNAWVGGNALISGKAQIGGGLR